MEFIWNIIGTSAAILTTLAFMPQLLKIVKTHSVMDLSIFTIIQSLIGVFLWFIYAVHRKDTILAAASTVTSIIMATVTFFYFKYREPPKRD